MVLVHAFCALLSAYRNISNRSARRDYVEKLKAQSPIEAQRLYWSLTRCGESRDSAYARTRITVRTIFAHKFACIMESTFKVFSFEYFSSVFNFTNPVCTDFSFRFVAFSHSLAPLSLTHCLCFFYNTGIHSN